MPLLLMCGIPGSGKSTRSLEICNYLRQKHGIKVLIINEQSLGCDKNIAYSNSHEQKMMRGKIKFQLQKNLTGETLVIVDSLNYIKGFRYQMYCIAREQKTTYCLCYCNTSLQKAKKYNEQNKTGFNQKIWEQLTKRMQIPHIKNRWDTPIFERREEQATPVQEIAHTLLFEKKKSKDPVSTKQEQKLSQDYLYEIDRICQQVCEQACLGQLKLKNNWNPIQAKKIKKDYMGIAKERLIPLKDTQESFMYYFIEADKRK